MSEDWFYGEDGIAAHVHIYPAEQGTEPRTAVCGYRPIGGLNRRPDPPPDRQRLCERCRDKAPPGAREQLRTE